MPQYEDTFVWGENLEFEPDADGLTSFEGECTFYPLAAPGQATKLEFWLTYEFPYPEETVEVSTVRPIAAEADAA